MTNKTLLEHVTEYLTAHDYPTDEDELYATFIECLSEGIVQDTVTSQHRWYDTHNYVHKVTIDDEVRYFSTLGYHITGDNCAEDMGLDMPKLSDVVEVHPREVLTVIYE